MKIPHCLLLITRPALGLPPAGSLLLTGSIVLPGAVELVDRHIPEVCQEEMIQDKVCATAPQRKKSKQQNSNPMNSNNAIMSVHP